MSTTARTATAELKLPLVIAASSVGTIIEWNDFYLYGSLAVFFSTLFFPPGHPTAALLASLATFGAGFAVRPFGAIVFGRLGDLVGRKYAFLVTLTVMGVSTVLVGLVPTYERVGLAAPALLVALRLLQGLALGGEYGGAATYVAEHAPDAKRGYYTSYIQTTATVGFLLALVVILLCPALDGRRRVQGLGMADPVSLIRGAPGDFAVHPDPPAGVSAVRAPQEPGEGIERSTQGQFRQWPQLAPDPAGPAGRDRSSWCSAPCRIGSVANAS